MTPFIFLVVVSILALFAFVFCVGMYYQKRKTSEENSTLDLLPSLPCGVVGIWGLIIIMKAVLI